MSERYVGSNGYVMAKGADGWVLEHRLVVAESIGRALRKGEVVHHRNGDRQDNRIANLQLCASNAEHRVEHRRVRDAYQMPDEPNVETVCACGCGESLLRYDSKGRPRDHIRGHNDINHPAPVRERIVSLLGDRTMKRSEIDSALGFNAGSSLWRGLDAGVFERAKKGWWRCV